ncbi:MAG: hypothetical protein U0625_04535 [Phycisphaerales bacterium]
MEAMTAIVTLLFAMIGAMGGSIPGGSLRTIDIEFGWIWSLEEPGVPVRIDNPTDRTIALESDLVPYADFVRRRVVDDASHSTRGVCSFPCAIEAAAQDGRPVALVREDPSNHATQLAIESFPYVDRAAPEILLNRDVVERLIADCAMSERHAEAARGLWGQYMSQLNDACKRVLDIFQKRNWELAVFHLPALSQDPAPGAAGSGEYKRLEDARKRAKAGDVPILDGQGYLREYNLLTDSLYAETVGSERLCRERFLSGFVLLVGDDSLGPAIANRAVARALEASCRSEFSGTGLGLRVSAPFLSCVSDALAKGGGLQGLSPNGLSLVHQADQVTRDVQAALLKHDLDVAAAAERFMAARSRFWGVAAIARQDGASNPISDASRNCDLAVRQIERARWDCAKSIGTLRESALGSASSPDAWLTAVRKCMAPELYKASFTDRLAAAIQAKLTPGCEEFGKLSSAIEQFEVGRAALRCRVFESMLSECGFTPSSSLWAVSPERSEVARSLASLAGLESQFVQELRTFVPDQEQWRTLTSEFRSGSE